MAIEQGLIGVQRLAGECAGMCRLGGGLMLMGVESGAIHQQRLKMRQVAARAGQHVQAPGVEVVPVSDGTPAQPGRCQPTQVQPCTQHGDGVYQGLRKLVQATFVFYQQEAAGRCRT